MVHAFIMSIGCAMLGAVLILVQSVEHWVATGLRLLSWGMMSLLAWHVFAIDIWLSLACFFFGFHVVWSRIPLLQGVLSVMLVLAPLAVYFNQSWHFISVIYHIMSMCLLMVASAIYTMNASVLREKYVLCLPISMSHLHQGRKMIEWMGMASFALSVITGYLMSESLLSIGLLFFAVVGAWFFHEKRSVFLLILMFLIWGLHGYF
jgi:hypothetical protein